MTHTTSSTTSSKGISRRPPRPLRTPQRSHLSTLRLPSSPPCLLSQGSLHRHPCPLMRRPCRPRPGRSSPPIWQTGTPLLLSLTTTSTQPIQPGRLCPVSILPSTHTATSKHRLTQGPLSLPYRANSQAICLHTINNKPHHSTEQQRTIRLQRTVNLTCSKLTRTDHTDKCIHRGSLTSSNHRTQHIRNNTSRVRSRRRQQMRRSRTQR